MAVTVGTTLTTLVEFNGAKEYFGVKVVNGGTAFNAFEFQVKMTEIDAEPWTSIPISTDFSSPWPVSSTVDLTTLTSSATGILLAAGKHWVKARIQASVASGSSDVDVYARGD